MRGGVLGGRPPGADASGSLVRRSERIAGGSGGGAFRAFVFAFEAVDVGEDFGDGPVELDGDGAADLDVAVEGAISSWPLATTIGADMVFSSYLIATE